VRIPSTFRVDLKNLRKSCIKIWHEAIATQIGSCQLFPRSPFILEQKDASRSQQSIFTPELRVTISRAFLALIQQPFIQTRRTQT
jgi:hypothetical protein